MVREQTKGSCVLSWNLATSMHEHVTFLSATVRHVNNNFWKWRWKCEGKYFCIKLQSGWGFLFIWLPSAHLLHPWTNLPSSKEFSKENIFTFFLSEAKECVNVRCTTATTCRQEKDVKHENIPPSFVSHFFVASSVTSWFPRFTCTSAQVDFIRKISLSLPWKKKTVQCLDTRQTRGSSVPWRCCRVKTARNRSVKTLDSPQLPRWETHSAAINRTWRPINEFWNKKKTEKFVFRFLKMFFFP